MCSIRLQIIRDLSSTKNYSDCCKALILWVVYTHASPLTLPESLIGRAISYTINQWPKLLNYLKDGRLEISNNRTERAVKPFATGRKNWLFADSVEGANAAAIIFSIIETCKAHRINSYEYLRYVLARLPEAQTLEELEMLLPYHCKDVIGKGGV